jgi:hypothetical protein
MNRAFLFLAICLAVSTAARAEPALPAGYSCADVRAAVEKYGRPRAIRLAKRKGASAEQIAAAEKCL